MNDLERRITEALAPFVGIDHPTATDWLDAEQAVRAVVDLDDFAHSLLPLGKRRIHVALELITGWEGFLSIREGRGAQLPGAEYGTGPMDDCVGCESPTTRWVHAMTSYPLCSLCMTTCQQEAGEA